jgi:hypothetical protein
MVQAQGIVLLGNISQEKKNLASEVITVSSQHESIFSKTFYHDSAF